MKGAAAAAATSGRMHCSKPGAAEDAAAGKLIGTLFHTGAEPWQRAASCAEIQMTDFAGALPGDVATGVGVGFVQWAQQRRGERDSAASRCAATIT